MRPRLVVPLVAVMLLTTAWVFGGRLWGPSYQELARLRNELASRNTTADLQVALVRTSDREPVKAFVLGARMAAEEINNKNDGVLLFDPEKQQTFRRHLFIKTYDAPAPKGSTRERIDASMILARQIVADPNVVAVLGHSFDAAVAVSVVYNASEVIFFAPRTTEPALTRPGMPYVFRICPNDNDIMNAMVEFVPSFLVEMNRTKKVKVLLLYPQSKARPPNQDPAKRLKETAEALLGNEPVEFTVDGRAYDPELLDRFFREKLILDTQQFNVIMIADRTIAAAQVRERIEEIWTNNSLSVPEDESLFQPKIIDLGQFVEYEDREMGSMSVSTEFGPSDYETMIWIIFKETTQNAIVLFERDASEAARWGASQGALGRWSRTAPISSRSSYGKRLIAYLEEAEPLTEDASRALSRLTVLHVSLARSYDPTATDFTNLVAEVKKFPSDYVYIIGFNRSAVELLKQLRRAGVRQPVIGSPRLEEVLLLDDKTEDLGETYVASVFDDGSDDPEVKGFLTAYHAYLDRVDGDMTKYDHKGYPEAAAYGYVSVQLLKRAFDKARTASPRIAAEAARLSVGYFGPLGNNRFDGGRDLRNVRISFRKLSDPDAPVIEVGAAARRRLRSPAKRKAL